MRILLLGGTGFIGRAVVEDALAHGHEPVLFTRGRSGRELFPGVSRLVGDRDAGDYASLRGGEWDAVVDLSGYYPRQVAGAMDAVGDRVGRYVFVSSHAVYDRGNAPGGTEDAPRRKPLREADVLDDETYGRLKVACEDDVVERFGERATVVRPIKVVGPHDGRDAATYWVRRAERGGRVAVPGSPEQPCQFVDSRDLARLIVRLVEDDRGGAFHAVGPAEEVTLGGVIREAARLAGVEVELVGVPLEAVPRFFPLTRARGLWATLQRDGSKAWAAGMPKTALGRTLGDLKAWDDARGRPELGNGLTAEREAGLLRGVGRV
ncbi:NAD-dependent epimerase/dehydratase family protein [Phytomonospora sp. NPDC050363]|uniref:NAD-dependent epimerase/dehydratase family protein n=1 Tax=Phytomonospora sp. NPDC050363 TaxID=3155642 RepID=UPI0033D2141A